MTKSVFFIGIKGVGMCALALCMKEAGWVVSGSDTDESFITDQVLADHAISVTPRIDASIPEGTGLIVCSAAYTPPVTGVRVLSLAEALAEFIKNRKIIAVAGVGGKTTTTAMLATLFRSAGRDVGYYVGTGSIAGLSGPGSAGSDPYFVVEADEYAISKRDHRPKFSLLSPDILITTNIIHDHPDIYANEGETLAAFTSLVNSIKQGGVWVYCESDHLTRKILQGNISKSIKIVPYGSKDSLDDKLELSVFGAQNQLDARAAVIAATSAGLSEDEATRSIKAYKGAGRRQEYHGEVGGRLLYDDYGHHPKEIELTVKSFKEHFPHSRVLLVFESHTYSRTEALLSEFARSIALADLPFIMPIFESAREKGMSHKVTPESFAQEIKKINPETIALTWDNAATKVWSLSKPGDLILTMGAGFVYKLHDQFKLK